MKGFVRYSTATMHFHLPAHPGGIWPSVCLTTNNQRDQTRSILCEISHVVIEIYNQWPVTMFREDNCQQIPHFDNCIQRRQRVNNTSGFFNLALLAFSLASTYVYCKSSRRSHTIPAHWALSMSFLISALSAQLLIQVSSTWRMHFPALFAWSSMSPRYCSVPSISVTYVPDLTADPAYASIAWLLNKLNCLLFHAPFLVSAFTCCPVAIVAKQLSGTVCLLDTAVMGSSAVVKLVHCQQTVLNRVTSGMIHRWWWLDLDKWVFFYMMLTWINTLYAYRMYCLQGCVGCGNSPLLYLCIA